MLQELPRDYLQKQCSNHSLRKTNKIRISGTENNALSFFKKSHAIKIETMGKAEVSENRLSVHMHLLPHLILWQLYLSVSLYQTLNLDKSIFFTDAKNQMISISVILDVNNKYENVYYKLFNSLSFLKDLNDSHNN